MKQKYNYTLNGSFEDAHHDCKLVADSIHDDESFQNADTGLVLGYIDRIIEALEKQIPKKPIEHIVNKVGFPYYECPICGECDVYGQKYCDECGQKLDWGEDDEQ